jgi:phosphoenolpyruvate-protein phosphotransferase (PTS system enzyme I)
LDNSQEIIYQGIPASPGIIIGTTRSLSRNNDPVIAEPVSNPELEVLAFRNAIERVRKFLEKTTASVLREYGRDFARIFDAQAMIAGDNVWNKGIEQRILQEKVCAEYLYSNESQKVIDKLSESQDSYLKERIQDIQVVTSRLISIMRGDKQTSLKGFKGCIVVVARYLSPADILSISFSKNRGFATGIGGPTSHASLMAKSLGIPAVIGIGSLAEKLQSGCKVIIDGYRGLFILNPTPSTIKCYRQLKQSETKLLRELAELKTKPAVTRDNRKITVLANIELPAEVSKVLSVGAQGIGLYRTEYLFLTRSDFPSFNDQYEAYSSILRRMGSKPVVIRTYDLGGDKFPDMAGTLREKNPFLGYRAIRICLDKPDIFKIQLKALLKASVCGKLSILIPMISNFDELMATRKLLEECKEELRQEKIKFAPEVPLGIMLEIPSAVMIADHLAKFVDFFSIGTNDLIQYTVAVDRDHELLSKLYQCFHPAVINLIKMSVIAAHRYHKKVTVCGEMASDPLAAVLLIGLGVDELSSSFKMTGILKRVIRSIKFSGAKRIADHTLKMRSHDEIEKYLEDEITRVFPDILPVIEFSRRNSYGGLPGPKAKT